MSNNTPDYNDNLAFQPPKTAGTIETINADNKPVAIRCYVDDKHYFDLALYDAPETMDWYNAKAWCEENYCRLPMKHELKFIVDNLKLINIMLKLAGAKPLKREYYWSSSEYSSYYAWTANLNYSSLLNYYKYSKDIYVRPVLAL